MEQNLRRSARATYLENPYRSPTHRVLSSDAEMVDELGTRARSSGRAAVERRTAFIGPTSPASERVPPRMWCTVNHLGMMTYSEHSDAETPQWAVIKTTQISGLGALLVN